MTHVTWCIVTNSTEGKVLLQKVKVPKLVKKSFGFYGIRNFLAVLTRCTHSESNESNTPFLILLLWRPFLKQYCSYSNLPLSQWRTQEFCSVGGVQQIQLRTEDRENGDLGAVAP